MKLCLFSVSYAGLWGQHRLELVEFIRKARSLGYDHVMLMGKRPHLAPLEMTSERLAQLKDCLATERVACAVVAGYTDFSGAGAAEVPFLEMQVAYVESLAKLAQALGATIVRVFSAYEVSSQPIATTWERTVRALRECCDRSIERGVTIAVQNHHDIGVHSEALLELLADVDRPNCKLAVDAWSPALRGEELYAVARKLAPQVVCTTNADYVRLPRFQYQPAFVNYLPAAPDLVRAVPFGEGFIDYPAFFSGLADGGFDGIATYEICSPIRGGGSLENLDRCAAQYLRWMRQR